jgi:hypothetical protein
MNDQFMVAYRNGKGSYTYSHSESSYSEASLSIPPADVDDAEYVIICPPGFTIDKPKIEPIKVDDLPF